MKRFPVVSLSIVIVSFWSCSCRSQDRRTKYYDIAVGTYSGETVRGPKQITAINLNTIRYKYQFGSVTTYQATPDLSKALTPSPVQAPSTPAKDVAPSKVQNQTASPAQRPAAGYARHTPNPATDPFGIVRKVIEQAGTVRSTYEATHNAFANEINISYNAPITKLSTDTTDLQSIQIQANDAVALVAQATSALTSFLASSPNESTRLVEATKSQLLPTSAFMNGINAQFPAADVTVSLQNRLSQDATALSNAKTKLSGYSPGELVTLQSGLTTLTNVKAQLDAAFAAFKTNHKPSTDEQRSIDDESAALNAQIVLSQNDIQRLKQLENDLTTAITQASAAVTSINGLLPGSTIYTNFVTAQTLIISWRDKMSTTLASWNAHRANPANPNPFAMSLDSTCEFAFSRTKDVAITLTALDLTPGTSNPTSQNVLSVTVECTSPLSVSAGVAFSTISEREFAIQTNPNSSDPTKPNIIIQTSKSNFHPLPLALANVRLWEPSEKVALYASAGVAANIRNQSAGGSSAEYLIGPSIGLFRAVFITVGAHLGSQPSVGGGYYVGEPVAMSLTTVPIKTAYTAGFGLGISFTKP